MDTKNTGVNIVTPPIAKRFLKIKITNNHIKPILLQYQVENIYDTNEQIIDDLHKYKLDELASILTQKLIFVNVTKEKNTHYDTICFTETKYFKKYICCEFEICLK